MRVTYAAKLFLSIFTATVFLFSCSGMHEHSAEKLDKHFTRKYCKKGGGDFFMPKSRLNTRKKVIALTFDACGGPQGSKYDEELIEYLREEKIKATLFINSRWLEKNREIFLELAHDPLFEIESHGYLHKPLAIETTYAYGIKSTGSIAEVIHEVEYSARIIHHYSGSYPRYFRSGTAWYDETSLRIIRDLGYQAVNFTIISRDYSPMTTKERMVKYITSAGPGDIVIMHMNHPSWNTKEALELAVPVLRSRGYSFVKLKQYSIKTYNVDTLKHY